MNSKIRVIYLLGILLVALPIFVLIVRRITDSNLSSKDSDAIYGGRIEQEYLSAGYLVSYLDAENATICGIVKISNNFAITAAHCLDHTDQVYLSADPAEPQIIINAIPVDVYKDPSWNGEDSENDFAILNFENADNSVQTLAQISTPKENCSYTIVGYGRTQDDPTVIGIDRTKRSATLCITNIDDKLIQVKGQSGGICLGDSGSPIYETGTDNVVAILSSVILDPAHVDSPCYVGNSGIAVRVDKKLDLISDVTSDVVNQTQVSDSTKQTIQALSNEVPLTSNNNGILSSITDDENKLFGIDINLWIKFYAILWIVFIVFLFRVLIFGRKKNS